MLSCSAGGPPYERLERSPSKQPHSEYQFSISDPGYLTGQLLFKTPGRRPDQMRFIMHVLLQHDNGYRLKSYQGMVYGQTVTEHGSDREVIELYPEHCYIYGKQKWNHRLSPLRKWDCDHLLFRLAFSEQDSITNINILEPVYDERSRHTQWMGLSNFTVSRTEPPYNWSGFAIPELPLSNPGNHEVRNTREEFTNSEENSEEILLFGNNSDRLLRPGNTILACNDCLNFEASSSSYGTLEVIEIVDHFVKARWLQRIENPEVFYNQR